MARYALSGPSGTGDRTDVSAGESYLIGKENLKRRKNHE
jgi:hypothetical protein